MDLAFALIDQSKARVIVPPKRAGPGYWFGGGNILEDSDGLHVVGRYRNAGDSTTGLGEGERGLELAVFTSRDQGWTFTKSFSRSKADLSLSPNEVVSIEGTALNLTPAGVELFLSTEKRSHSYPDDLRAYQKPGTGVWTIDRIFASSVTALEHGEVVPLLSSDQPEYLHIKDPVIATRSDGATVLIVCTHPFSWSSSNSAYCVRPPETAATQSTGADATARGGFDPPRFGFFARGSTWDVAATRITDVLSLDPPLTDADVRINLVFYDGAECLRSHTENKAAVSRPRGYSCEELGGLAVTMNDDLDNLRRLTVFGPGFVSPYGTGSSRYVHTLLTDRGIYATWQQARDDGSQPLVMNFVSLEDVRSILSRP